MLVHVVAQEEDKGGNIEQKQHKIGGGLYTNSWSYVAYSC